MKQVIVLKIIVFFGLFISNKVYCQKARIVDLRVIIVSPIKNSYIKSPGSVSVQFSVYNKGPDAIKPADTIIFYPKSNDTLFKYKRIHPSKIIHARDSEVFSIFIPHNAPYDNNFYNLGITTLYAYNKSPDSIRSEPLNWQKDNTFFTTVKHRSATSKQESIQNIIGLTINPNPGDQSVYIKIQKNNLINIAKFQILDLQGNLVMESRVPRFFKDIDIPINELANGLYILNFISNDLKYSTKLIVNHQ